MKEELKKVKELLIVVDMVNGFVREGALADTKIANIIPEQVRLIEQFLNNNQAVMFIKDCHEIDSVEFNTFPPHCIKGTEEAQLVDELRKYEGLNNTISIEKNSTSAIFAPGFLKNINYMENLETLVGVGCESDICVPNLLIPLKNYFNQNNRNINIIVPENAVDTFDSDFHNREEYQSMAFKLMEQSGIQLVKKY